MNLKFDKIYEEIPFEINNTPLDKALLHEYKEDLFTEEEKFDINI